MNFLLGLSVFSAVILFLTFIGYPTLTRFLAFGRSIKRTKSIPKVTVIIPAYNEERFIAKKIENMVGQLPKNKIHIIVADSKSTDRTWKLASEAARKYKGYKIDVLRCARGKVNAMNTALSHTKTEIVVVSDADVILKDGALRSLISSFSDGIGGVSGRVVTVEGNLNHSKGKSQYHKKDWDMRYKESLVDSCLCLDGKLMAFRRSLVDFLPPNTITDDFEITLLIRKAGYRCIVDNNAEVIETPPGSLSDEIEQMRRRSKLTIGSFFRYPLFVFNPRCGYYGVATLPFRRVFPLLTPVFLIGLIVYPVAQWPLYTASALIFGAAFLVLTKKHYNFILLWAVILSWYDVFTGNIKGGGFWKKTKHSKL